MSREARVALRLRRTRRHQPRLRELGVLCELLAAALGSEPVRACDGAAVKPRAKPPRPGALKYRRMGDREFFKVVCATVKELGGVPPAALVRR